MNELVDPKVSEQSEEKIKSLIAAMQKELKVLEDPLIGHHFSEGVYARTLFIPEGCCAVGKIHKFQNLNMLIMGALSIWISEEEIITVKSPYIKVSPPGTRRVVFAHEDSIWVTIHHTFLTDPKEIEDFVVTNDIEEYKRFIEEKRLLEAKG